MMCRDRVTRSRALITWPSSGQPEALAEASSCVMPSSCARLVICSAKVASLPARPSATTTQASLPDWTMMPWIRPRPAPWCRPRRTCASRSMACACGLTRNCGVVGDAAVADRLEEHVERHQLRHRGRRHRRVGVLLEEHHAGGVVDHQRLARLGLEGARPASGASASARQRAARRGLRACANSRTVRRAAARHRDRATARGVSKSTLGCINLRLAAQRGNAHRRRPSVDAEGVGGLVGEADSGPPRAAAKRATTTSAPVVGVDDQRALRARQAARRRPRARRRRRARRARPALAGEGARARRGPRS